jgi:hypothetical protein
MARWRAPRWAVVRATNANPAIISFLRPAGHTKVNPNVGMGIRLYRLSARPLHLYKLAIMALLTNMANRSFPLSFAQEGLWFMEQLVPNHAFYNLPVALWLDGILDVNAMERALNELVNRHEVLRTRFVNIGGRPEQVTMAGLELKLKVQDLAGMSTAEREADARRLLREEAEQPFDLAEGPMVRAELLRLGEREHLLLFTIHHIVSDGWSMGVVAQEVSELYGAFTQGRGSRLAPMGIQYSDFVVWQRECLQATALEEQLKYWRKRLKDAPPLLTLPIDRPRPPTLSYRRRAVNTVLTEELSSKLRELSQRERATLFMTLLAAFKVLFYRYTWQDDVIVGSPIANRHREEFEPLIGLFVNMLVLRTDLSGNPTFRTLLRRVREVCLDAYAHGDLPFEKLVAELRPERDPNRSPFVQIGFVQNARRVDWELPGLKVRLQKSTEGMTRLDQEWHVREQDSQLYVTVYYSADLYQAETVERMLHNFTRVLEAVVADADQAIGGLDLLGVEEREQVLEEWCNESRFSPA